VLLTFDTLLQAHLIHYGIKDLKAQQRRGETQFQFKAVLTISFSPMERKKPGSPISRRSSELSNM
jgi:hypothetical protein